MARQNQQYVTQEELEAALEYAIKVLETIKVAVRGAMYQDGRVVFRVPIPDWYERITLMVGGRPGCECQRAEPMER